ncbi:alpha/beta hydrolase [Algimonas ampicilliniresistens]|nr:alpha/beta hydrolase [Algimonas ampicilliniresistens]
MTIRITVSLMTMAIFMSACANAPETVDSVSPVRLMTWSDLTSRDLPQPTSTHAYGDNPAQIADLWLPDGPSPHPAVLMVHGGCWQKAIADRTLMNYAAEDLRQRGLAVWNIEYRGVDEIGGGYPGTFLDVSMATNMLVEKGPKLGLAVEQIVAIGHSAGGHLAAWLAAQPNLRSDSDVSSGHTAPLAAVIISGGLADLEASEPVTLESCLGSIIDDLTGSPDEGRLRVFSDTSPTELLPVDAILISVNGDKDRIAPPELGRSFTKAVRAAGGQANYIEIRNAGHVELISPGTEAFEVQAKLIESYVNR